MSTIGITANTLVKNEGRFLWFSVVSIIDHVDRLIIWDTGSSDNTKKIIRQLKKRYPEKIDYKFLKDFDVSDFAKFRQEMLDCSTTDWVMTHDGDEIWFDDSISKVVKFLEKKGRQIESVAVPTINLIGDIFHHQEEKAGKYKLAGRQGHLNLRFFKKSIPGLKSVGEHGVWGWEDINGKRIQERKGIRFLKAPYIHASFLQRSKESQKDNDVAKRKRKRKYEIGKGFAKDFYYPEAFFKEKPTWIDSPWEVMDNLFIARAIIETPLKKIKRRIVKSNKYGY